MQEKTQTGLDEEVFQTACASHCGGSCILKVHVKNGVITRIDTDDGEEPQLRACLRGRSQRQRVYAKDRILYPLKRTGKRGEGKFERISWDEAIDTVASQIIRVRDTYGPASILNLAMAGDVHDFHNPALFNRVLSEAGGFSAPWGMTSFQGGVYAQRLTYGSSHTCNTRDDLPNSRLIIMWGWNPSSTITGVNTGWYLSQAKEAGARIVSVDPRYTDSTATYADQWIPIRPGTDGAMLLGMAYVLIEEKLYDQKFLDAYTVGFDKFKDYVTGQEDGQAKTPAWAESISGVPASTIAALAREYATTKPAVLGTGIAPGRTAYGEQYHRIAMTVAAMAGNVGIHGGDGGGRIWESIAGGYPYKMAWGGFSGYVVNPVDQYVGNPPKGAPIGYRENRVHFNQVPDFILKGRAGGFHADVKLIATVSCAYVNSFPDINKIIKALSSDSVEFHFIAEQFMTPTVKYADIVLPINTFLERNDFVNGMGLPFYAYVRKVIESRGESKSQFEISRLLGERLGLPGYKDLTEAECLRELAAKSEIPDYENFKETGIYRFEHEKQHIANEAFFKDPVKNPLKTPSGKVEIYSQALADLNWPNLPAIPKYIETWESKNDPLAEKYPIQMITSHLKRRANAQFDTIPWLRELERQEVLLNTADAADRGISHGDMVRVFNDRGEIKIPARVSGRIMPGVIDVPHGAWYNPDKNGADLGGNPNVLIGEGYSPGGSFAYNTSLVQVEKAR